MDKDAYMAEKIKYKVYDARKNGKGFIIVKANREVRYQLKQHFNVEPYYYEITLSFPFHFKPSQTTAYVVKDMYFYKKNRHADKRICHLSPSKVKACRDFGLEVKPIKYKIY